MRSSILAVGNRHYSGPIWPWVLFSLILLSFPLSGLRQFPYTHELINTQLNTQGRHCRSLAFSRCATFFSLTLCPVTSSSLPEPVTHLHNSWKLLGFGCFPPFYTTASKLFPTSKLGHCRDCFIYFPGSGITAYWLISDDLRKVVQYILSTFLVVSRRSINLVLVIYWLKVEVLTPNYILMLSLIFLIF